MLRLTLVSLTAEEAVLQVEGWIAGTGVTYLGKEGQRQWGGVAQQVVDLDGVKFIDEAGLELLQAWRDQGVVLRGGSVFIRMLLTAALRD